MSLVISFDQNTYVGEMAAQYPALIPLFEKRLIGFGCGAELSLAQECLRLHLTSETLLEECRDLLLAFPSGEDPIWKRWTDEKAAALITHILNRYHEGHRNAFPLIEDLQEQVLQEDGDRYPDLMTRLCMVTQWLFDDLRPHMLKEEQVLFPLVHQLLGQPLPQGRMAVSCPIQHPITAMKSEHQVACNVLREIDAITHHFIAPADSSQLMATLFSELKNLTEEIHRHIHMENNVLFPMVLRMVAV